MGRPADVHNTNINEAAARAGRCGTVHLPTGRMCRLPALHDGACQLAFTDPAIPAPPGARGQALVGAPRVSLPAPQWPRCILWVADAADGRYEDPADRRAAQDRSTDAGPNRNRARPRSDQRTTDDERAERWPGRATRMYQTEDGRAGRRPHHGTSSGFDVTGALPGCGRGRSAAR